MGDNLIKSIKGLSELESKLNNIPNKTMAGVEKAIEFIYQQSQPLVPVDTGALKKSGKIKKITNGYQLSYHSINKKTGYNYAPIQHENTTFKHKIGKAKYLEQPIKQNINKIKDIIVKEVVK